MVQTQAELTFDPHNKHPPRKKRQRPKSSYQGSPRLPPSQRGRSQVTAPDGTIYIKSKARVGSLLHGKWHKIPPPFKTLSQAGDKATVVDSPPFENS